MPSVIAPLRHPVVYTGLLLLAVSLALFSVPLFYRGTDEFHLRVFMGTYGCSIIYLFFSAARASQTPPELKPGRWVLLLLLLLVSAYALNRCMDVFADSPAWLCIVLVLIGVNYLATLFFERLPVAARLLVMALMAVALLLFAYLSCYLLPIYAISIPGLIAFGISVHTFVPLAFVFLTIRLLPRLAGERRSYWIAFGAGAALTVFFTIGYGFAWRGRVGQLNAQYREALADGSADLPVWIQLARSLPQDRLTEKVLKSDLVYVIPQWETDGFWQMPSRSLGELTHRHDPLVVLANLMSPRIRIGEEERIRLLSTQFGARHHSEERLWTGVDLTTEEIRTQVRLWPSLRLAYTEQLLTVFNHAPREGWRSRTQEAIYTFRLPEGGVVTALSLWVNGREEQAILTTREKADSAYRTIVGGERRDPSVVHWQEGNRVTVRVFPVNAGDRRDFRIGVTAPLRRQGGKLIYESLRFEGPDASGAQERVQLKTDGGQADDAGRQVAFRSGDDGVIYQGGYRAHWSYALPDPGLSAAAFSFQGQRYSVGAYRPMQVPVSVTDVYLDVNSSWTAADFDAVLRAARGRRHWVWEDEGMVAVTDANRDLLFKRLSAFRFSLFPVFRIARPASSLLVSKNGGASPALADLRTHPFYERLKAYSRRSEPVVLFNLGHGLTPYLEGLLQYRCFRYQQGTPADLATALAKGVFQLPDEGETRVALPVAGIELHRAPGAGSSAAPDHLLRLFAYSHLLRAYGQQGIDNGSADASLVAEARLANIVSPVSSLVVLETAADYERFGIDRAKDGLGNATLKANGAVPEPHEWVLLVLGAVFALYLWFRSRF
ncbi:XrtN system VIT domain-containing protein [Flaviaesturariibacter amylovorans]|uniref:VIT domain-containing protein n=1 Tax=Flaviaesturariibacter amylovorans TaxID=1084520 RepID=A0ABP8GE24_9BACT